MGQAFFTALCGGQRFLHRFDIFDVLTPKNTFRGLNHLIKLSLGPVSGFKIVPVIGYDRQLKDDFAIVAYGRIQIAKFLPADQGSGGGGR